MKVLVDANSLCYRAKHTLGELTSETMRVGIIFGFLGQILKLAEDYNTNDITFCWDSKESKRREIFPAYKEKRRTSKEEKSPEEIEEDKLAYQQFDLLCDEILIDMGFVNNYKIKGYEGDDLLASIVYANPDDFVLATSDEDMFQLLDDGVCVRRSRQNNKGKKEYYLYEYYMFVEEYGIFPDKWIEVKALAGCKTDEVPGIPGIGEDTAIKYLKGDLTPNMKRYQSIVSPEGKRIKKRNLALVSLPFEGCPDIVLEEQKELSLNNFIEVCKKYEFQYYLKKEMLSKWKKALHMV